MRGLSVVGKPSLRCSCRRCSRFFLVPPPREILFLLLFPQLGGLHLVDRVGLPKRRRLLFRRQLRRGRFDSMYGGQDSLDRVPGRA